jgi:hypothetical protein
MPQRDFLKRFPELLPANPAYNIRIWYGTEKGRKKLI